MWGAQGTIGRPYNQEKGGFLTIGTWFLCGNWSLIGLFFSIWALKPAYFSHFNFQCFFLFLGWYFLYHDHCAVCCSYDLHKKNLELVSEEFYHPASILHVCAGNLIFMMKKNIFFFKKRREILLIIFIYKSNIMTSNLLE